MLSITEPANQRKLTLINSENDVRKDLGLRLETGDKSPIMTPIQPGMCFSDEPMIAIPGEFGIRLEDDVYIADDGAHFFTKQSIAIDKPFG